MQKEIGVKYRIPGSGIPSSLDTTCLQALNSILYLVIFFIFYIHFQYNGYFLFILYLVFMMANFYSLYLYSYIRSYILN